MLEFKPPKDSPFLIGLAHLLNPIMLRCMLHDTRIQVVGDGLERFKQLQGKRTIICPNHSSSNDPEIMFSFSTMTGESFNFMAAREVFEWNGGLRGSLFQRMGVYSVVRGAPDREAFKTTKALLVAGKKKLVIFPEGEISHQNDTLMPLETGIPQMAFWAIDELQKEGVNEPVIMLPMAAKYTYRFDISQQIETSLWRLEDRLDIHSTPHESLYVRLRNIAEKIISSLEREYDRKPPEGAALNDRINAMRDHIIKTVAGSLQVTLSEKETQLSSIRVLRNHLDDFVYQDESEMSAYDKKIHDEKVARVMRYYSDLDRVVRFIAIYDGYLREHLTQERFADVLHRLEREVFGTVFAKGPRLVMLDVGRPINLLDHYADYKANKRATLHNIMQDVSEQINTMLHTLEHKREAIFID